MFINYYELFPELDDSFDAREENLDCLEKKRTKLNRNTSPQGRSNLALVQNAIPIFNDIVRHEKYQKEYGKHQIMRAIDSGLMGDNEISVPEFDEIIRVGKKFGYAETGIREIVEIEVAKRGGNILDEPGPEESSKSTTKPAPASTNPSKADISSAVDALTPITRANVASGVAVTIAILYLILIRGGIFLAGWFGPLLFILVASVSVKNYEEALKRHAWGIIAAIVMYITDYSMFLTLLPVFIIWHFSPTILSSYPNKLNLVWLLPVILSIGVYGSVEAIQRVPRRQPYYFPKGESRSSAKKRQSSVVPRGQLAQKKMNSKPPVTGNTQPPQGATRGSAKATATPKRRKKARRNKSTGNTTASKTARSVTPVTSEYSFVNASIDIELFAADGPLSTGLDVNPGDTLTILVLDEGKIKWSDSESSVGPDGASFLAGTRPNGSQFLSVDAPCGSVVGRIGEAGAWFNIGGGNKFVSSTGGTLYLSINDLSDGFDDNFGMFNIEITQAKKQLRRK